MAEGQKLEEASQWASANGWTAVWSAASRQDTPGQGPSGGTAVLARDPVHVGIIEGNAGRASPHNRLTVAQAFIPGLGTVMVMSAYLKDKVGMNAYNRDLLAEMATEVDATGMQAIIAGDFNMHPKVIIRTGWHERLGASLCWARKTTCRMKGVRVPSTSCARRGT